MNNYLANTNSGEIHRLSTVIDKCKIDQINTLHKKYLETESQVDALIKSDKKYDGCGHCYKEKHTK